MTWTNYNNNRTAENRHNKTKLHIHKHIYNPL